MKEKFADIFKTYFENFYKNRDIITIKDAEDALKDIILFTIQTKENLGRLLVIILSVLYRLKGNYNSLSLHAQFVSFFSGQFQYEILPNEVAFQFGKIKINVHKELIRKFLHLFRIKY